MNATAILWLFGIDADPAMLAGYDVAMLAISAVVTYASLRASRPRTRLAGASA